MSKSAFCEGSSTLKECVNLYTKMHLTYSDFNFFFQTDVTGSKEVDAVMQQALCDSKIQQGQGMCAGEGLLAGFIIF